jgi:hypothetical protein
MSDITSLTGSDVFVTLIERVDGSIELLAYSSLERAEASLVETVAEEWAHYSDEPLPELIDAAIDVLGQECGLYINTYRCTVDDDGGDDDKSGDEILTGSDIAAGQSPGYASSPSRDQPGANVT